MKNTQQKIAVAELEYLGVSLRVINSLEESKYNVVYLKDLFSLSNSELSSIPNLGKSGIKQIFDALSRIDDLEEEKSKWEI